MCQILNLVDIFEQVNVGCRQLSVDIDKVDVDIEKLIKSKSPIHPHPNAVPKSSVKSISRT